MRNFKEILAELGEALDINFEALGKEVKAEVKEVSNFPMGKTIIGYAFVENGNHDLFINKTDEGSYLYQMGYSDEAPIGRTKEFLNQDFITLTKFGVMKEIAYQKEKEGGFWWNQVAPKLPVGY
jgi:hypothetical protein